MTEAQAELQTSRTLPPSPPRTVKGLSGENAAADNPGLDSQSLSAPSSAETVSQAAPAAAKGGSFADLKKGRQAGRKTFAEPARQASPPSLPAVKPVSPSSLPLEDVRISDNRPSEAEDAVTHEDVLLPLLDPLAPGSALTFVSFIRRYSASSTLPQIQHLSTRPNALGRMLDNFLEPDQLALILRRLRETLDLPGSHEEVVRLFMIGLTQTRRWAMTSIMLSKQEKELAQSVWKRAGGQGDWAKPRTA